MNIRQFTLMFAILLSFLGGLTARAQVASISAQNAATTGCPGTPTYCMDLILTGTPDFGCSSWVIELMYNTAALSSPVVNVNPLYDDGTFYGTDVNIATPGQVLISNYLNPAVAPFMVSTQPLTAQVCFTIVNAALPPNFSLSPDNTFVATDADLLTNVWNGSSAGMPTSITPCPVVGCPPGTTLTAVLAPTATTCGNANGSIATTVGGTATGPFTFTWTGPTVIGNVEDPSGLASGTYIVTVTSDAGCTASAATSVASSTALTATVSTTNTSCTGNTGTATATAAGGNTGATFAWSTSPVQTGATANGLAAGNYTVTVTKGGCTAVTSAQVSQNNSPTITLNNFQGATCGLNNGSASVTVAGGTGTLTTTWTPGNLTGTSQNGLAAGSYTATVLDQGGCSASIDVFISDDPAPTVTVSVTPTTCGASNGTATANAQGGSGSFTYAWSVSGTGTTVSGLAAGTVASVTVTDVVSGCTAVGTGAAIGASTAANVSITTNASPSCGLSNGSLTATSSAGCTFAWSNGVNTATISNLAAGTYTVTATCGACTAISSVTLTNLGTAVTVSTSSTPTGCGAGTGSVTANVAGGDGTFTYIWSNGSNETIVNDLGAGTYTVTVSSNGCSATASANVSSAGGPTITNINAAAATCGQANGSLNVSASGGTGTLSYLWSNGATSSSVVGSVAAGDYSVTVTDGAACQAVNSVTVANAAGPTITNISSTSAGICGTGNTGTATVTTSGGTPTINILWSSDATGATANGLSAGDYTVTVSDANGCLATSSVTVTCGTPPVCQLNEAGICILHLLENPERLMQIIDVPFGQAISIDYTTNPTVGEPGYVAGYYVCTDADCNDVVAFFETTSPQITNPTNPFETNVVYFVMPVVVDSADPLNQSSSCYHEGPVSPDQFRFLPSDLCAGVTINVSVSPYTCTSGFAASATGGTGTYTFTPALGSQLSNGNYTAVVVDGNGCQGTAQFTVDNNIIDAFLSYNCNGGGFQATVIPNGNYSFNGGALSAGAQLANGTYSITVSSNNGSGCSIVRSLTVNCGVDPCQGVTINASASYDCTTGLSYGAVNGGQGPYTFSTASGTTGLADGNYNVVITDANGCTGATAFTVNCPIVNPCDGFSATASYNCTTGLSYNLVGGQAPFDFTLGEVVLPFPNGDYNAVVTDANDCEVMVSFTINCGGGPTCDEDASTSAFNGQLCTQAGEGQTSLDLNTLVVGDAGGTWSSNAAGALSGSTFSAVGAGSYTVTYTVAGANGCADVSTTQTINVADCNLPPVAVNDVRSVVTGTVSVTVNVVTANDSDPEDGTITLTGVSDPDGAGGITVDFDADGNITLFLNGATGTIVVNYTITDNVGQVDQGTLTVTVGDCIANLTAFYPEKQVFCADGELLSSASGCLDTSFNEWYLLVDNVTGEIVDLNQTGAFASPTGELSNPNGGNCFELPEGEGEGPLAPAPVGPLSVSSYTEYAVYTSGGFTSGIGQQFDFGDFAVVSNPQQIRYLPALKMSYEVVCEENGEFFDLVVYIQGGYPQYAGVGSYNTNFGNIPFNAANGYASATILSHVAIPDDGVLNFNFAVNHDGSLCDKCWVLNVAPNCPLPPPCNPIPGIMVSATAYACYLEQATVTNIGATPQDYDNDGDVDEIVSYYMYDADSTNIQISNDATFEFIGVPCPATYYAGLAIGPDNDGDGFVDWTDECTRYTPNSQPVTFLCEVIVESEEVCNFDTGEFVVILMASGGVPQVDPSETYSLSGTGTGEFENGAIITLGPYAAETAYNFVISDSNGCSATVAGVEDCKLTPVELLNFSGEVQERGNMLKWTTASEINNSYFTLSRSTNGTDFETVAKVTGAGNSSTARDYAFLDKNAPSGLSYYKLSQTDFNGASKSFEVITLLRDGVSFGLVELAPVPARSNLDITFATPVNGTVEVTVFDAAGKLIHTQNADATNGLNSLSLNVTTYASGVYFVRFNNGVEVLTTRFVKE